MKVNATAWSWLAAAACSTVFGATPSMAQQPAFNVYASGLEGPRGLTFGADGNLYVAEAGTGGSTSTAGLCLQVPGPPGGPGPWTGGSTARISKVGTNRSLTTVASGFPSTISSGGVIGVADVIFVDGTLYALVAGGGCSHGNPQSPNGIARVDVRTGKWKLVADLSAFIKAHPAKYPGVDDFEPDGTLYSFVAVHDVIYAVEPNHGQIFSVTAQGGIKQAIDISASEGHIVPTAIAQRDGHFYVGNLDLFPIDPLWARVLTIGKSDDDDDGSAAPGFEVTSGYHVQASKAGFTTAVSLKFGPDGLLYVLELSDGAGFPTPGLGKVVRVKHSGAIEEVITGLSVPTGMTFGPDGRLYVSDLGAAPPGAGRILQFDIAPGW
jgi:hypothetical protein